MIENLHSTMKIHERRHICWALEKYKWDKHKTAKALGIGLSTLYRKIAANGIRLGQL